MILHFMMECPNRALYYDTFPIHEGSNQEIIISPIAAICCLSRDSESAASSSENPLMRCKRIAHLFFEKYIDYHSEHEINISGPLRNKYVELERGQYEAMELEQFVNCDSV